MTKVTLDDIGVRYTRGARPAIDSVSLTVNPGELVCLVGPSGCGKTTLLKVVSGLLFPTNGQVFFDETQVTAIPPEKRSAPMVFQNHLLFPFMSVLENVGFALRMRGVRREQWEETSRSMLDRVHLGGFEGRRPDTLSAGQRQRVALVRALVAEPRVLLLDEPLSNLDRHLREEMRQVILELQREAKVTTLCVTHDQEEAVLLGDRIVMLSGGHLIQEGSAEEFYERPATVQVARFFGNHNQIEGIRDGEIVTSSSGAFRISTPGHPDWPESGNVCLHVRPEALGLSVSDTPGDNQITGRVLHRVYVGTYVRYVVEVDERPWQVVGTTQGIQFEEGDIVNLTLPPERLWLTRE